jgi:hypothetical protein
MEAADVYVLSLDVGRDDVGGRVYNAPGVRPGFSPPRNK